MLRLRTFGGLSVERVDGERSVSVAAGRRRLALLAVLAASEARSIPRDKLLALFWPESDMGRARHALDQTLYALKRDRASGVRPEAPCSICECVDRESGAARCA